MPFSVQVPRCLIFSVGSRTTYLGHFPFRHCGWISQDFLSYDCSLFSGFQGQGVSFINSDWQQPLPPPGPSQPAALIITWALSTICSLCCFWSGPQEMELVLSSKGGAKVPIIYFEYNRMYKGKILNYIFIIQGRI
jgi:hypothetical protein